MASTGDPSGGAVRRTTILGRVVQMRRGRRATNAAAQASGQERRIEALEGRVDQLEALLEGPQNSVHREAVR
jgi:hypothetical protein